jgi:hypothetical protein
MLALLSEAGFQSDPAIALPGAQLTVKIWTARKQAGAQVAQMARASGKTLRK